MLDLVPWFFDVWVLALLSLTCICFFDVLGNLNPMGLCLPWRGQSQRQRNGIGDELGGHWSCFHKILVIQMESYVTPRQDHFMASGDSDDPCCVYVEKLFISL